MLNGLDLFSGIGGISLALSGYVRPVAYCEIDKYAQSVLLSRMGNGDLPHAPIWDDIQTLRGCNLPAVDIIYGGFPCQDISIAGAGKGLAGERSGLFYEILRLAKEIKPAFIFLENVPAIRKRGLNTVVGELADAGYDCRWCVISAAEVGANHERKRWFLLAFANSNRSRKNNLHGSGDSESEIVQSGNRETCANHPWESCAIVADSQSQGPQASRDGFRDETTCAKPGIPSEIWTKEHWELEPNVGRVVNGLPQRVDRIKSLGNGVVPLQVKTAFETLIGINYQ